MSDASRSGSGPAGPPWSPPSAAVTAGFPLLELDGWSLTLAGAAGRPPKPVLRDISLSIGRGECVGLAGESGSGKTVLAMAVMGLLPPSLIASMAGRMRFAGTDLMTCDPAVRRDLRGRRLGMVFQEPMTALNPLLTVGEQIRELAWVHGLPDCVGDPPTDLAVATLRRVGMPDAERWVDSYPHQLSGGMRQRAMMAVAMALDPDLVLADEPTTALDAALQLQVIDELRQGVVGRGRSLLFVSHDLGVLGRVADRLAVLYAGELVEVGPAAAMLAQPRHPYTAALVASLPRLSPERRLPQPIPGRLPAVEELGDGCVFAPRCVRAEPGCRTGRIAWRTFDVQEGAPAASAGTRQGPEEPAAVKVASTRGAGGADHPGAPAMAEPWRVRCRLPLGTGVAAQ